jgi:integrase
MSVYRRGINDIYWYKFTWNGTQIRESTRQSKKRVAEELEAAHRTRLARGEAGIITGKKRLTLEEYSTTFIQFVEVRSAESALTVKFYKSCVRRLLEFKPIASAKLQDIDEGLIEAYIQHRRQTVAPSAVDRELTTLRRMLKLACDKWKLLQTRPYVQLLHRDRNRDYVCSRTDETRYLAIAPVPLRLVALIAVDAGLRISEICRLQWAHVDIQNRTLRVIKGKSANAKRTIDLTDRLCAAVAEENAIAVNRAVVLGEAGDYIFPGRDPKKPVSVSWLEKLHRRTCRTLGFPDEFVIHSLRHTFGTRLGENKTDVFTIKDVMGHSSVTVSQKYVHPGRDVRRRAIQELQTSNSGVETGHKSGHTADFDDPKSMKTMPTPENVTTT